MPAAENLKIADIFDFVVRLETDLSARPKDVPTKRTLDAIAKHSTRIAQRLTSPTREQYREFLAGVAKRPKRDPVRKFLLGEDGCYTVKSPQFLRLMTQIVTQFAERVEGTCKPN